MAVDGTDLLGPTVPYSDHGARSLFTANNGEAATGTAIEVLTGSRIPNDFSLPRPVLLRRDSECSSSNTELCTNGKLTLDECE